MDKFRAMQVFTRVVDSRSFAAAADSLNITRSSTTTIIQDLESYLKVRLLNRTTRRISLTPDGAAYYERCKRILAEVEDSEQSFSTPVSPRGKLKIDMPGILGRMVFVPALEEFHTRFPDITVMLGVGDKPVDLVQEGVDCAIRMGPLEDSSLVARRIGLSEFVTVASPGYLDRHGTPLQLGDLTSHWAVNYFSSRNGKIVHPNFVVDNTVQEIRMQSRLAANDGDAYLQCGLNGLGLIQIPYFLAYPHIQAGDLAEVLAPWRPDPFAISAVYPQNRHLSPQVRVFVDWSVEVLDRCHLLRWPEAFQSVQQPRTRRSEMMIDTYRRRASPAHPKEIADLNA